MISLPAHQLEMVRQILRQHVPGQAVWAFGSRVTGERLKPFSDLDLVIITTRPLTARGVALLKDSLAESSLPIKVDVLDWCELGPGLRQHIESHHEQVLP